MGSEWPGTGRCSWESCDPSSKSRADARGRRAPAAPAEPSPRRAASTVLPASRRGAWGSVKTLCPAGRRRRAAGPGRCGGRAEEGRGGWRGVGSNARVGAGGPEAHGLRRAGQGLRGGHAPPAARGRRLGLCLCSQGPRPARRPTCGGAQVRGQRRAGRAF